MRRRTYERIVDLRLNCEDTVEAIADVRREEGVLLIRQWDILLNSHGTCWGRRSIDAVIPSLVKWMERCHGELNYYATQLLTGHGSFGRYLWRMGKRETAGCQLCPHEEDSVEHHLVDCPTWQEDRSRMRRAMELPRAFDLTRVISTMVDSETAWTAFVAFASSTMRVKEEEERRRERDADSPPPAASHSDIVASS